MIKSLRIDNFIIVEKLLLDFEKGLQVLTGETGAGKSIIVGAIDVILGGPVRPGMVYDESKPAYLETVFDIDKENKPLTNLLGKHDIDLSENEIFLAKEIASNLRGKSFLNGRRITNPVVKEFREVLLDFHSQRDQQRLFDTEYQLEVLDKFGNMMPQREKFGNKFRETEQKIKDLIKLEAKEKELSEKVNLYHYQVDEIEKMQLKNGEDSNLQTELNLLTNAEDILNQAVQMEQIIYENENSVYDIINGFISQFSRFEEDNPHLKNAVSSLHESLANLDESISQIREVQNIINVDSTRLEEVQERLDSINSVCLKYKRNVPQILEYIQFIKKELASYSSNQDKIKQMQAEIENDVSCLRNMADELTESRRKAAARFEEEIESNIKKLAIPDARIEIKFDNEYRDKEITNKLAGLNATGQDEIDIFFSANKGVKLQSLRFAASGGELSRFLLTVKKILSDKLDSRTIIFDEIDAGIGGRTADLLADFIHNIGRFHQVLCISHLPQIASYADRHFAIVKKSGAQASQVEVSVLDKNEKREEIARMLSGSTSELAIKHADEIINKVKGVN
ncbi:MAG: DNA repair protein RecN [Candidatus Cloacimonetes bacterium]|nr:DNA repair protein RecN [Candidatus Cloacimonadota bacterium]